MQSNAPETTDNSLKVEDAIVQTVQDTQVGAAEGGVQVAAGPVPSVEGTKVTAVVHQPVPTVSAWQSHVQLSHPQGEKGVCDKQNLVLSQLVKKKRGQLCFITTIYMTIGLVS